MNQVAAMDIAKLQEIRDNVSRFIARCAAEQDRRGAVVLDVAPQDHAGAGAHFRSAKIETLDIAPESGATYIADLTQRNDGIIPANRFDCVICTEVLEHTVQPFDACTELLRILKPGGVAYVTTPLNFRIHGPLPDCWRFTEHGLRVLFAAFELIEITPLEDEERFLMPTQYTLVARKPLGGA